MSSNKIEQYPPLQYQQQDDEIDLKALFIALWKGKLIIIGITFIFAIAGVFFALSQPNTYQSNALLSPTQSSGGGMSGLASKFGGLASLAGVSLGGDSGADPKVQALAVLKSRKFINAFVTKHNLLVPLMAATSWSEESNKLILDDELYNSKTKQWLNDDEGETLKPTLWDAYKSFKDVMSVSEDKDSGMVTVAVTHYSPYIAKQWVEWLVQDLNAWMKADALEESEKNINYIEGQLAKTSITEIQTMFYDMIEDQQKNKMLAEVQDEYVFKTIDPAVLAEEKAGPKRALICVLATLLGGMLGVAIVLVRYAFRKEEEQEA
ncbi:Wzz/FepE/Etk N-terminal domain-containing protein [Vibrio sp. SS-MA-C1-2]|uniref:Wzz/FepE/Etk N-terminal domain-containing protein n=1 Tax=Vibrio sp. SS-MA-C1-2 TaxID=2908646 RepID=UPI001F1F0517|nr:Wzz/FepE/Etk N-terminal domain-containing protein [Vibrio sp. SS-MA-C1-2]UJF18555.1 Wzz/FepE/Etk N-terminal domain-containing protein [Vibrio sp. SS-MA-C1-2]